MAARQSRSATAPNKRKSIDGPPRRGRQARQGKQPRYATSGETLWLTIIGVIIGILLLATLVALMPAAVASTSPRAPAQSVPLVFGVFDVTLHPDAILLLLVITASSVGSFVHVATSFSTHVGRNRFEFTWATWYLFRIFIGASLASVFYFVMRAGFLSGDQTNTALNAYGIAAIAGFVGLFSRQATDKLRELFDTLFKTDSVENDDTPPDIDTVKPDPVPAGSSNPMLVVTGTGFQRLTDVEVGGHDTTPTFVGPGELRVEVKRDDLPRQGFVDVVAVNPGAAGRSEPYRVMVAGEGVDEDQPEASEPAEAPS
jgi:hypothetical protein